MYVHVLTYILLTFCFNLCSQSQGSSGPSIHPHTNTHTKLQQQGAPGKVKIKCYLRQINVFQDKSFTPGGEFGRINLNVFQQTYNPQLKFSNIWGFDEGKTSLRCIVLKSDSSIGRNLNPYDEHVLSVDRTYHPRIIQLCNTTMILK